MSLCKGHFEDHPGHIASSCFLRDKIIAYLLGTSSNGYRCAFTGSHCIPGEYCDKRREAAKIQDELNKL